MQRKTGLVIMLCGKICSGKTVYSSKLRKIRNCVVLSCDEIMLPLEGYLSGDYDEAAAIFKDFLLKKACEIAAAGVDAVIDFGQWKKAEREEIKAFFAQHGIETELHYIKVSDEVWEKHIEKRNNEVSDGLTRAYYVDEGLKNKVLSRFEEPSESEVDYIIEITQ